MTITTTITMIIINIIHLVSMGELLGVICWTGLDRPESLALVSSDLTRVVMVMMCPVEKKTFEI